MGEALVQVTDKRVQTAAVELAGETVEAYIEGLRLLIASGAPGTAGICLSQEPAPGRVGEGKVASWGACVPVLTALWETDISEAVAGTLRQLSPTGAK